MLPLRLTQRHAFLAFTITFLPLAGYATFSVQPDYGEIVPGWWTVYEQGWPWIFLKRSVPPGQGSAWLLFRGIEKISAGLLLANLAVAALIGATVSLLWYIHTARHGKPWQFSLRELLGVTALSAMMLSGLGAARVACERELRVVLQLERIGWSLLYEFPFWRGVMMRPLIELNLASPDSLRRPTELSWSWGVGYMTQDERRDHYEFPWANVDTMLREIAPELQSLRYCRTIEITDPELTDAGVEALCANLHDCRYAYFSASRDLTDEGLVRIVTHWPNLEKLELNGTGVSNEGIGHLKRLPELAWLSLEDVPRVSTDGARQLAQLPNLRYLRVPANWMDDERFRELVQARAITVKLSPAQEEAARLPRTRTERHLFLFITNENTCEALAMLAHEAVHVRQLGDIRDSHLFPTAPASAATVLRRLR